MTRHSFEIASWLPPSGQTGECAPRREEAGEKNWHVDYSSSGHQEKQSSPSGCSFVTIGRLLPPELGLQPFTACRRGRARDVSCAYGSAFISCVDFSRLSLPPPCLQLIDRKERRKVGETSPETNPLPFPSRATGEAAISSRWMAVLQKYGTNYDPDLVCHKESHPPDKIGAPGCHKKWPEHSSSNWPR